jgi:dolichol kinase
LENEAGPTFWQKLRVELARKAIHLGSSIIPLLYLITPRNVALWILGVVVVLFVWMEFVRKGNSPLGRLVNYLFGFMLRRSESGNFTGATWVVIAAFLTILLFPDRIAVAVLLMLSISDSFASLIGMTFGHTRWIGGKSLAGSGAFFLSAVAIGNCCLPGQPLTVLAGALAATFAEAIDLRIGRLHVNDNLLIPLIAGGVMQFFSNG